MPFIAHLSNDKKLQKIIALQNPPVLSVRKNIHYHLCNSIMSQQLSTKVADVFQKRFLELFKNKIPPPQQILDTSFESLRGIGLSNAKANYVHNICTFFIQQKLTDRDFYKMSNEDIVECLTQIKGVGKWTVEMVLMFTLGREDVFAIDDLAIQQSMCKLYKIDATDKKALKTSMEKISNKWKPYRSYACRYLWGWKDIDISL
jgi:DNA-3-methyladenine glycosylase II